jgi:hypothetical protein
MIRRLAHRNANVQLYTLELANALSQNCGIKMHKELASRSFTEALLRLANDRNTHQQVKAKILERMSEWSEMFSRDPDLGIMQGAYNKLKSQSRSLGREACIAVLTHSRSQLASAIETPEDTDIRVRTSERGGGAADGTGNVDTRVEGCCSCNRQVERSSRRRYRCQLELPTCPNPGASPARNDCGDSFTSARTVRLPAFRAWRVAVQEG